MHVYRIENQNHIGPFQDVRAQIELNMDMRFNWDPANYPSPNNDPLIDTRAMYREIEDDGPMTDWAVGCSTPAQLKHWFNKHDCEVFDRLGFFYTVYDIDKKHYFKGKWQVVFDEKLAKCNSRQSCSELWKGTES